MSFSVQRIVTHTDFDGLACAVLLLQLHPDASVAFTEPWLVQRGKFMAEPTDAFADLPYPLEGCAVFYDHHAPVGDLPKSPSIHLDQKQPSCAGYIFRLHKEKLARFAELAREADRIDSARFTKDDLLHPGPAAQVSMALTRNPADHEIRMHLIGILSRRSLEEAAQDTRVKALFEEEFGAQRHALSEAMKYTTLKEGVILTDLTERENELIGVNPFLLYVEYPSARYSLRIRRDRHDPSFLAISVSENIFASPGNVHIGRMLQKYDGGGHKEAGGCTIPASLKEKVLDHILSALK